MVSRLRMNVWIPRSWGVCGRSSRVFGSGWSLWDSANLQRNFRPLWNSVETDKFTNSVWRLQVNLRLAPSFLEGGAVAPTAVLPSVPSMSHNIARQKSKTWLPMNATILFQTASKWANTFLSCHSQHGISFFFLEGYETLCTYFFHSPGLGMSTPLNYQEKLLKSNKGFGPKRASPLYGHPQMLSFKCPPLS